MSQAIVASARPPAMLPVQPPATVRPAAAADLPAILALVDEHARRGNLLPRSPQAVASTLADWLVADSAGQILGCVSLLPYTSGLVEVRSLAVADSAQGQGLGTALVLAAVDEARRRGIGRLFTLTRAVRFFASCGFTVTEKHLFPEKVWIDCHKCPVRHHCDETAMILDL